MRSATNVKTIKVLRKAQSDLKKLKAIGVDESAIRRVMLLVGFGDITPDEFLTAADLRRLAIKIGRPGQN